MVKNLSKRKKIALIILMVIAIVSIIGYIRISRLINDAKIMYDNLQKLIQLDTQIQKDSKQIKEEFSDYIYVDDTYNKKFVQIEEPMVEKMYNQAIKYNDRISKEGGDVYQLLYNEMKDAHQDYKQAFDNRNYKSAVNLIVTVKVDAANILTYFDVLDGKYTYEELYENVKKQVDENLKQCEEINKEIVKRQEYINAENWTDFFKAENQLRSDMEWIKNTMDSAEYEIENGEKYPISINEPAITDTRIKLTRELLYSIPLNEKTDVAAKINRLIDKKEAALKEGINNNLKYAEENFVDESYGKDTPEYYFAYDSYQLFTRGLEYRDKGLTLVALEFIDFAEARKIQEEEYLVSKDDELLEHNSKMVKKIKEIPSMIADLKKSGISTGRIEELYSSQLNSYITFHDAELKPWYIDLNASNHGVTEHVYKDAKRKFYAMDVTDEIVFLINDIKNIMEGD